MSNEEKQDGKLYKVNEKEKASKLWRWIEKKQR